MMPDPVRNARILRRLRKIRMKTDRDAAFVAHLDRLLERDAAGALLPVPLRFSSERETRGVMVIDGPGGGKTTLIADALESHPALGAGGPSGTCYLGASVPSPATFKSMGRTLLERSGYPIVNKDGEGGRIWAVLRGRLRQLGIAVLWIDEAHDLFCADRNLILRALKSLMQGDEAVVVVLSGTARLREIVRSDPQVQRRFSTLSLPPVSVATDGAEFEAMIAGFCDIAGLQPPRDEDLIARLVHAGRYRFGRCIEAVIGAIERALDGDARELDIGHFAESWALQEGCAMGKNIFRSPDWAQIDPDRSDDEDSTDMAPRSRRRSRR